MKTEQRNIPIFHNSPQSHISCLLLPLIHNIRHDESTVCHRIGILFFTKHDDPLVTSVSSSSLRKKKSIFLRTTSLYGPVHKRVKRRRINVVIYDHVEWRVKKKYFRGLTMHTHTTYHSVCVFGSLEAVLFPSQRRNFQIALFGELHGRRMSLKSPKIELEELIFWVYMARNSFRREQIIDLCEN